MNTRIVIIVLFLNVGFVKAQAPYWKLNGNPVGGSDGVNGTNNSLGTNGGFSLNFKTNNIQRMTITDGGNNNAQGRIGIGNNLPSGFTPLDRLHLFQQAGDNYLRFSQNSSAVNGFQLGLATNGNAEIRQSENNNLDFFTAIINKQQNL